MFIQLSFGGFTKLLESLGWGLSSSLEYYWRRLFQILFLPQSQSLLSFWGSSCSYAATFDWVPLSLMLSSVLSILFLSVLQFGSSLIDFSYAALFFFFRFLDIHKAITIRLVQLNLKLYSYPSFAWLTLSHHPDFMSSGMTYLISRMRPVSLLRILKAPHTFLSEN